MQRVSLADIARDCGLSKMTVSRALRNQPYVTAAKRAAVLASARRLGYRQDPRLGAMLHYLRSSKRRRSREVLALLWLDAERADVLGKQSPFRDYLGRIVRGASARADELGYGLEQFWLRDEGISARRLGQILQARGIKGVIIGQPVHRSTSSVDLDWSRFCVVQLDEHPALPRFQTIEMDNYAGVALAVQRLEEAGFTRIALCEDPAHDLMIRRRWRAAFLAYHPLGATAAARLLLVDEAPRLTGRRVVNWWKKRRPDVVLLREPTLPEDWRAAIHEAGVEDFRFACLNLRPAPGSARPGAGRAGVYQSYESYAATAVEMVAGLIQRNECGVPVETKTVTTGVEWIPGRLGVD